MLALKIFEILGIFAIAKLWKGDRRPINYTMAVLSGAMLGVAIWNTYAFVKLWHIL